MSLSPVELDRYSRQLLMGGWGATAQRRCKQARALIVGVGALGTPVAQYLAAAGVGQLGLVDGDDVELSHLHRQPLHFTPDVGGPKAETAAAKLALINGEVLVDPYPVHVESANAGAIVAGADVVVDCTDSEAARLALADGCQAERVPLVTAALGGLSGFVLTIVPGHLPCLRCALEGKERPGPTREVGTLGAMAGIVGSIQALEALKLLAGFPVVSGRPLSLDGWEMAAARSQAASPLPGCEVCGAEGTTA